MDAQYLKKAPGSRTRYSNSSKRPYVKQHLQLMNNNNDITNQQDYVKEKELWPNPLPQPDPYDESDQLMQSLHFIRPLQSLHAPMGRSVHSAPPIRSTPLTPLPPISSSIIRSREDVDQKIAEIKSCRIKIKYKDLIGQRERTKVYKGQYDSREVAVKVFDWVLSNKIDSLFMRLQHPSIVRAYGMVRFKNSFGLVTELADSDLAQRTMIECLEESSLPPVSKVHAILLHFGITDAVESKWNPKVDEKMKLKYLKQVAYALEYLHDRDILHLDVKPSSILIFELDDCAKLANLDSLTPLGSSNTSIRQTKVPSYNMPPEVFAGAQPAKSADIWSFGITILEVMTGSHAWPSNVNENGVFMPLGIKNGEMPPKVTLLDEPIRILVSNSVHYDPRKRPDMQTVVVNLEKIHFDRKAKIATEHDCDLPT